MDELMIKIENVTKEYRLGAIGGTTLREELQRARAKRKHQEDPTLKIGQTRGDSNERFMALNGVSFEVKKGEAASQRLLRGFWPGAGRQLGPFIHIWQLRKLGSRPDAPPFSFRCRTLAVGDSWAPSY